MLQRSFIAVLAAALIAVATPAFANIVWATFAEAYCTDPQALWLSVISNTNDYYYWFVQNAPEFNIENDPYSIAAAIENGVQSGGGCN